MRPLSRGEFNLPSNCFEHAKLQSGQNANLVIAKKKSGNALDSFFAVEPEDILLVMINGEIKLHDESLRLQLPESHLARYSAINLEESTKYIKTDIASLIDGIKHYYPQAQFPFGLTNTTANV